MRLVVVHLDVRYSDLVRRVIGPFGNFLKQFRNRTRNYSAIDVPLGAACDRKSLAATRLPIRKNSPVVPIEAPQNWFQRNPIKHLVLTAIRVKYTVELERVQFALVVDVPPRFVARNLERTGVVRLRFFLE